MKIELNIGLNVKSEANTQHRCTQRARKALEIIKAAGLRYKVDRLAVQHEGDDGVLQLEDALVVEADVPPVGGHRTVNALAYEICREINQDCVAVYFPLADRGELIGPNASAWGEFNHEFFYRFADVALPRAA